jgi:mRNA interferase MazF
MKGNVVVVPFPFSDQSDVKNRPALILIEGDRNDIVLAAISSSSDDANGITLLEKDFSSGKLKHPSVIRAATLFTADRNIIQRTVGTISPDKHKEVINKIISLLGERVAGTP